MTTAEERVEILDNSVGTINHHHWPLLQSLCLSGLLRTPVSRVAMKGLLRLSTLTDLSLSRCTLNNKSINLIQPGSWPCVRRLQFDRCRLRDPAVAVRALLHLTGLERLSLVGAGITCGKALAQLQPGSWPNIQVLDLTENKLMDDPVGAMRGLHLTSLQNLSVGHCRLTGEAVSQIKPGDWPHLQILDMYGNGFSADPVGAMKGLLHLTSLQHLNVASCRLTGEAVSQIKPGDWPHLQQLHMYKNNLSDFPVGAMKGLLCLTALSDLALCDCGLSGVAVIQIKPGDWSELQKLNMSGNYFTDDKEGATQGLLHLTSLKKLEILRCGLTKEEMGEIHRALQASPLRSELLNLE